MELCEKYQHMVEQKPYDWDKRTTHEKITYALALAIIAIKENKGNAISHDIMGLLPNGLTFSTTQDTIEAMGMDGVVRHLRSQRGSHLMAQSGDITVYYSISRLRENLPDNPKELYEYLLECAYSIGVEE